MDGLVCLDNGVPGRAPAGGDDIEVDANLADAVGAKMFAAEGAGGCRACGALLYDVFAAVGAKDVAWRGGRKIDSVSENFGEKKWTSADRRGWSGGGVGDRTPLRRRRRQTGEKGSTWWKRRGWKEKQPEASAKSLMYNVQHLPRSAHLLPFAPRGFHSTSPFTATSCTPNECPVATYRAYVYLQTDSPVLLASRRDRSPLPSLRLGETTFRLPWA